MREYGTIRGRGSKRTLRPSILDIPKYPCVRVLNTIRKFCSTFRRLFRCVGLDDANMRYRSEKWFQCNQSNCCSFDKDSAVIL